jgi:hypothetical protein
MKMSLAKKWVFAENGWVLVENVATLCECKEIRKKEDENWHLPEE